MPATPDPRSGSLRRGQFEYRTLSIPYSTSPADARRYLTDEAEYGRWELARVRLFVGGRREVVLRRRVIRVEATF